MSIEHRRAVSVIGGVSSSPAQNGLAEQVGALIAEAGAIVVCGGRGGVMEAACRGAYEAGGITIGILPGFERSEGNPYLTVAIPTGLKHARNALVVQSGEVVIAIGGGYGTLSEIGMALKMGRRVIGLDTWLASDYASQPAAIIRAQTPHDAVRLALFPDNDQGEVN